MIRYFFVILFVMFSSVANAQQDFLNGFFQQPFFNQMPPFTTKVRSNYSNYGTRRFSTKYDIGNIIVSFGDRKLYYIYKKGRAIVYPIGIPRLDEAWHGKLRISRKAVNPRWTPTAEMRRKDRRLPRTMRGGHPRNPLGKRALYLGKTLYRIHGTDAPYTIGRVVSSGCIRMHNSHVIDLYRRAKVGDLVYITYKRFK